MWRSQNAWRPRARRRSELRSGLEVTPSSAPVSRGLFVLVAAIYLLAFPYHPRLRSPNELSRLWMTRAMVDYGTLEINQALRDYGFVGDLSVRNGRYYSSKAPLLSFAAVPIYAVLRAWGGGPHSVSELALVFWSGLLLTVIPTLVSLICLRRFVRPSTSSAD